jgi:hypothetical protein
MCKKVVLEFLKILSQQMSGECEKEKDISHNGSPPIWESIRDLLITKGEVRSLAATLGRTTRLMSRSRTLHPDYM